MIAVRAVLAIAVCLAVQAALARVWPASPQYVDLTSLPVIWFAAARSQRSGMLVGCAAGLAYDAWFRAGVFGLGGFIKTFLGWAVGAVGSRIDLNQQVSRFAATVVVVWIHGPLELGLRRLLDQTTGGSGPLDWTIRAFVTGLVAVALLPVLDRLWGGIREPGFPGRL